MRMIFLLSVDFRSRMRKRMKTSALKRHENTINHRRPILLIAEITMRSTTASRVRRARGSSS